MGKRKGVKVEIANRVDGATFAADRLEQAVHRIAIDHGFEAGDVSLAIVSDAEIQELNRAHLQHDWPTDVISFVFEDDLRLEGEIIVSLDTAARVATERNVAVDDELLLYVIHGMLHLVGLDDLDEVAATEMREQEQHYLLAFGVPNADQHILRFLETEPESTDLGGGAA